MKVGLALAVLLLLSVSNAKAQGFDPSTGDIAAQAGGYTDPFSFDNYYGFGSDPALASVAAECDTLNVISAYAAVVCLFSAGFADALLNPFCYASAAGLLFSPICQSVFGARGSGGPYRIYPGEL